MASLRIAFFGTPEFAVPTLTHLLQSSHRVVGVVTQPDRPRGRGQRVTAGPVKRVALEHQLPLLQPERMSDAAFIDAVRGWHVDLAVVAAYGRILPRTLLELPHLGMINVHASLLPKYRGAAPIQRAVIAGERETGITIIRLIQELDAGPMLARLVQPIGPEQTSEDVEHQLAVPGAVLLVGVVDDLAAGLAVEAPQDPAQATYAPRLNKSEGLIDWTQPAQSIHDRIRGLRPWPQAFTFLDGARYIILKSRAEPHLSAASAARDAHPGELVQASGERLIVRCGDHSALAILEIQPEGRRPLDVREFLAGHHAQPGQVFGAPKIDPAP
jgi:methionyl-tRNA formyltransferase